MLHVYSLGKHVAMIALPPRCADAYRADEPWCLLHNTGRVDRFPTQREAKAEARKAYAGASFSKTDKG